MTYRVSREHFGELVERALADVPMAFARMLEEVPVEVRDEPGTEAADRVDVPSGELLLGLYVGRPRTDRHVDESGVLPDVIYIYQRNLERVVDSEAELVEQVRITVLHEIGHHFGLDEDDLDELGYS